MFCCLPVCQDWTSSDETGPLTSCGEASCPGERTSRAQRGRTPECVPAKQELVSTSGYYKQPRVPDVLG